VLHSKAADVREARLGDVEGAIAHYRRVLELDETNQDAASALERLYQSSERYEERLAYYESRLGHSTCPPSRSSTTSAPVRFTRRSSIARTGESNVYQKSLAANRRCRSDRQADRLLLRLNAGKSLLEAYTHKADIATSPIRRRL